MAQTANQTRAAVIQRVLKQRGGRVLAIGGNLQEDDHHPLAGHPQIVAWEEHEVRTQAHLPENVRILLYQRWINTAAMSWVLKAAKDLQLPIWAVSSSKEIREILLDAFGLSTTVLVEPSETQVREALKDDPAPVQEPPKESEQVWVPVPPPAPPAPAGARRKARLGEIPAFLIQHGADLKGDPSKEAKRLLPQVHAYGIEQTEAGLRQNIQNLKKLLAEKKEPVGPGKTVAEAIKLARKGRYRFDLVDVPKRKAPPAAVPTETALATFLTGQPPGTARLEGLDFEAVEQLFRNAIESLKAVLPAIEKAREVLPALELVQDELPKVKAEIEKLNRIREAMK